MKKKTIFLFALFALLIPSCGDKSSNSNSINNIEPTNSTNTNSNNNDGNNNEPEGNQQNEDLEEEIESPITKIVLNHTVYDALVSKPLVNEMYVKEFVSSRELTDEEKEVKWFSTDSSIFEVREETGKITPKKVGSAYIVCESVPFGIQARCLINIVNSLDDLYSYEYVKVTDFSSLLDKDTIIIASPEDGVVATSNCQGSNLHCVAATFDNNYNKITDFDEDLTETFYLGEEEKGFTLQARDGKYLAGFNEKRVGFVNNKGNIHWVFTMYENQLYIETYNDVRGWLMYNHDLNNRDGGFTLYEREDVNQYIHMPTIYKLTKIVK